MRINYITYKILGFCMVGFAILGGAFIEYDTSIALLFIVLSYICLLLRTTYKPW